MLKADFTNVVLSVLFVKKGKLFVTVRRVYMLDSTAQYLLGKVSHVSLMVQE